MAVLVKEAHLQWRDGAPASREALFAGVGERRTAQSTGLVGAIKLQHTRAGLLLELCGALVRHGLSPGEHHA